MELKGTIARKKTKERATAHYTSGHHKIPRTWVIVADSQIAHIYSKVGESITMLGEALPSQKPVLTASDEKKGITHKEGDINIQYAPSMSPQRRKAYRFAYELSEWLSKALHQDAFDRLVLVAPPQMLEDLRDTLKKSVASRLVAEVNKDLTGLHETDLQKSLEKVAWI